MRINWDWGIDFVAETGWESSRTLRHIRISLELTCRRMQVLFTIHIWRRGFPLSPVASVWSGGTWLSPSSSSACSRMLTWFTRWENSARVKAMDALYCFDPKDTIQQLLQKKKYLIQIFECVLLLICSSKVPGDNHCHKTTLPRVVRIYWCTDEG